MTAKDLLPIDAGAIFTVDEFAEFIQIDGVILRGQVSRSTNKKSGNEKKNFDGLMGDFATIYFRTEDYCRKRERIPRNGEFVYIGTSPPKKYEVISCEDELGVTRLEVDAYRQNTLRNVSRGNFLGGDMYD